MSILITENEAELIQQLGHLIEDIFIEAISLNGVFKIGVSGGSLVKFLAIALKSIKTDFSKWKIFFCDERVVPIDSPDSTFGIYKKELIGTTDLKDEHFVQIKQGVKADEAAKDYIQQMALHFPSSSLPTFDLLLLGMGPDGHTCSLFPDHALLEEKLVWVAHITDSPKPPSERITLTFPVINNAKHIIFALAGDGKADMVKRILVDKEQLPSTMVQPTTGKLYWILDKAAGKLLEKPCNK